MRYGHVSQLAPLDCTSSRRSTVMCALPRVLAVTTEYQRDSSSKRPRWSVVSAVGADARGTNHVADTASRASRPTGGVFDAPGPRARHVAAGSYAIKLTLARTRQAFIERLGLDERSFHISVGRRVQPPSTYGPEQVAKRQGRALQKLHPTRDRAFASSHGLLRHATTGSSTPAWACGAMNSR
jgi:hypothetical protein